MADESVAVERQRKISCLNLLGPKGSVHVPNKLFFFFGPVAFLDIWSEVMVPTIATLLSRSIAVEFGRNLGPVVAGFIIKPVVFN